MPPEAQEEIKRAAKREGISMAEFLRRAGKERAQKKLLKPSRLGTFETGYTDTGRMAGEVEYEPLTWRS
jgi:hypothetical protein